MPGLTICEWSTTAVPLPDSELVLTDPRLFVKAQLMGGWEDLLGKQEAELKCGVSRSPLLCSSRIINSFASERCFEPLCHCCAGRKIRWKESRRLELRSHFICVASGESSSLRSPLKRQEKSESAAVFDGNFIDIMYR